MFGWPAWDCAAEPVAMAAATANIKQVRFKTNLVDISMLLSFQLPA
jgi:hypothetical protein